MSPEFRRGEVYVVKTKAGLRVTDWHGNEIGTASVMRVGTRYNKRGDPSRWRSYRVRLNDGTFWYGRHNSDWAQALRIDRDAGMNFVETDCSRAMMKKHGKHSHCKICGVCMATVKNTKCFECR